MKTIVNRYFLAVTALVLIMAVANTSCRKNTDCNATIIVVNATGGAPVVGASVTLNCNTCQPVGNLQSQNGTTDASGRVSFTFRYEAVLDVVVVGPGGSPTANSVVKLEAGKSVEKKVQL